MSTLTDQEIDQYNRDGFIFPRAVMTLPEAQDLRSELEALETKAKERSDLSADWLKSWPHFVTPFLDELSRRPSVTGPVSSILGDDLLVWGMTVFIKEAHSPSYVGWHQDLHYWGLDDDEEVTAWIALSPATVASGCMKFVAGSHKTKVAHVDHDNPDAILSRGQELAVEVDEDDAINVVLQPGQMSLHHGRTFHASAPNTSDDRRIGVAIRYIRPDMKQEGGERGFATLVRGVDRFGNFNIFSGPREFLAKADLETRAEALAISDAINYK